MDRGVWNIMRLILARNDVQLRNNGTRVKVKPPLYAENSIQSQSMGQVEEG
jgi:hypothetical protein